MVSKFRVKPNFLPVLKVVVAVPWNVGKYSYAMKFHPFVNVHMSNMIFFMGD